MSLHSLETKTLIAKGFQKENIFNPFIEYMASKNSFPLSKAEYVSAHSNMALTPMGAAFFIVPFVNAVTRSGTLDEKKLCFKAMLEYEAFKKVPSTKRGHKVGEEELLVLQAVRTISNVKNRQTRAEEAGMSLLEDYISSQSMLENKILLFLLKDGEIDPNIRGLVANKMMARYQRPCMVLTEGETSYNGSIRGYTKNGLDSFKNLIEKCPGILYVQGHDNAAGAGLDKTEVNNFLDTVNDLLSSYPNEPIYRVDYQFDGTEITEDMKKIILEIADMNDYWGQDVDRALVSINFKITDSNFKIMKSNTLKFELGNNLSIIKFGGTEDEIDKFTTQGFIEIEAICECRANEWNGMVSPQLIMKDYNIIDSCKYYF